VSTTVMGVAPRALLNVADRRGFAAASMHRFEPALPLRGGALITNQRPPQRDGSLLRVPAVPDTSARSRVGGRGRRRRCRPAAPPNPIASTTPLIGRRQRLSRRRHNRNAAVVENRPSPGMPRAANARPSLSGASPVAVPAPAPPFIRSGDKWAACADARHGRRPSPSSTGPTVAAPPPQARIAACRLNPCRAERWSPISARPRWTTRCYACRRCLFCRLDLGSGVQDSDADVRPSRRRMRSRRRLTWSVAVNDSVVDAADAPSSPSVLRFPTARRRYRSGLSCVLRSPHYLLPLSLALRDTSRVLSCPVLVAT